MSIINSDSVRAGASGAVSGYTIDQSCRFNDDDSAYLSRTPTVAGNRRTWTYSVWFKRGNITSVQNLFNAGASEDIAINASDQLIMNMGTCDYISTQVFRDPSAWFHLIVAVDTTHATAASRVRFYGNGTEITAFGTETNPAHNEELAVNSATLHTVGANEGGTEEWDGYLADVHFIDGQQLTSSNFGETDDNGNWVPIEYAATADSADVTYSQTDRTIDTTPSSTTTFSSQSLGTSTAHKVLVVISSPSQGDVVNTVTVDGNSCTNSLTPSGGQTRMWEVDGITSTTGDIVVGLGGTPNLLAITVYAIYGAASMHAGFALTASSGADITQSISVPAGGVIIGSVANESSGSGSYAWTGITESYDEVVEGYNRHSGAEAVFSSAVNVFVTCDITSLTQTTHFNLIAYGPSTPDPWGFNGFHLDFADSSHFGADIAKNIHSQTYQDFMEDITDASLTTNLKQCLDAGDATSYTGSGKWNDLAGSGYDMFFGEDASSEATDPTFNGASGGLSISEYMSTDGGDHFAYDASEETWMNFHSDSAVYTIWMWVFVPSGGVANNTTLLGTDTQSTQLNGIRFGLVASGDKLFLNLANASSSSSDLFTGTTAVIANAWNFIAVSINEAGGNISFFYQNGHYSQVSSSDTFDAVFSSPSATQCTEYRFFENGYRGEVAASGFALAGFAAWNGTALTKANLDTLYASTSKRFAEFLDTGLATNDQVPDSPTDDVDNDVGNYCTWNPLDTLHTVLSNGNLNATGDSSDGGIRSTLRVTGKKYAELKITGSSSFVGTRQCFGIIAQTALIGAVRPPSTADNTFNGMDLPDGIAVANGTAGTNYTNWADEETCCIAVDVDAGKLWARVNGASWLAGGDPTAGSNPTVTWTPNTSLDYFWVTDCYNTSDTTETDFGQLGYTYTAPTGFDPTHTANLPAPAITDPSKYFQVDTFSGTGSELVRTLTDAAGGAFKPDLVWIKDRDSAVEHVFTDSVRGATKETNPNAVTAETTVAQGLKSFDTSGYTLGTDTNYNASSSANVAWCWNTQGGAGASNEDGSINTTSTSVGELQGMSFGVFDGTGSNATVGHGLSQAPELVIVHDMDNGNEAWVTQHVAFTGAQSIALNSVSGVGDDATAWQSTFPTSSVFSIGTNTNTNASGRTYIAWCMHGVEGYSKFDSYVGTSSTDGTFIYCGFTPKWIFAKTTASDPWNSYDTGRDPFNPAQKFIRFDATSAEGSGNYVDFLSNGFKWRSNDAGTNDSGRTYIFGAFAEFPFGGEDVSQARAR